MPDPEKKLDCQIWITILLTSTHIRLAYRHTALLKLAGSVSSESFTLHSTHRWLELRLCRTKSGSRAGMSSSSEDESDTVSSSSISSGRGTCEARCWLIAGTGEDFAAVSCRRPCDMGVVCGPEADRLPDRMSPSVRARLTAGVARSWRSKSVVVEIECRSSNVRLLDELEMGFCPGALLPFPLDGDCCSGGCHTPYFSRIADRCEVKLCFKLPSRVRR